MQDNPLTKVLLAASFRRLICSPDFINRIKWWLTFGYSAERWLQFEYAHSLQLECDETYPNQYAVACEQHNHTDIVLCNLPLGENRPIEEKQGVAKLEMKVNGNWYTIGNTFTGISDDVNKVDGYNVPSVALVFWIFAEPTLDHPNYGWINKQVNCRRKKPSKEMVFEEMQKLKNCSPRFEQIFPDPKVDYGLKRDYDFKMLDFFLYEHRNSENFP